MALSLCRTTVDDSARELMEHGTAAFPIACYHDDLQAEPVPWHWHEELEVLVVSEGMILATAGGEKFRLGKGEGLFINAGVLHGDWPLNAGPCRLPRLHAGCARLLRDPAAQARHCSAQLLRARDLPRRGRRPRCVVHGRQRSTR